jgi:hypothetical protein
VLGIGAHEFLDRGRKALGRDLGRALSFDIARLVAHAHADERTQRPEGLILGAEFLEFPNKRQHVIERRPAAGMNGGAVVEPFHAKIRLVIERFATCDSEIDAEFGRERHKDRVAKRAGRKGLRVVSSVRWLDRK